MTLSVDLAAVEQSWQRRGFSFGVWTDPPGRKWEDYVHDTDELFMVVRGSVELEMQGRRRRPACGEEILIPRRIQHSVRNVGQTHAKWLYGYRQVCC